VRFDAMGEVVADRPSVQLLLLSGFVARTSTMTLSSRV
jgi:hypothetical protein